MSSIYDNLIFMFSSTIHIDIMLFNANMTYVASVEQAGSIWCKLSGFVPSVFQIVYIVLRNMVLICWGGIRKNICYSKLVICWYGKNTGVTIPSFFYRNLFPTTKFAPLNCFLLYYYYQCVTHWKIMFQCEAHW